MASNRRKPPWLPAGDRRNERQLVSILQHSVGLGVGFVDRRHRRLRVARELRMGVAQRLPDIARRRAVRKGHLIHIAPGDIAEHRKIEQPNLHGTILSVELSVMIAGSTETRVFGAETIVAEALEMHPKARWVFAAYHLSGCSGCGLADEETLAEVADGYGIELDALLADLNSLFTH
jgi:hybrid cluster-associated redox disulfide protein